MKGLLEVVLTGHFEGKKGVRRCLEKRTGLGNVRTLYFLGCFCVSRREVWNVDRKRMF